MEGAQPQEVVTAALEHDAVGFDKLLQGDVAVEAFELFFWDTGHTLLHGKNPSIDIGVQSCLDRYVNIRHDRKMEVVHRELQQLVEFGMALDAFVERLRTFRRDRGLSQTRLAELLGVSPRVYHRWESGSATPRFDTVVKLSEILEVSLDELAGREPPKSVEFRVHNPKLHSLYREIDKLSDEDQQALAILLDSLVKRSQMDKVLMG